MTIWWEVVIHLIWRDCFWVSLKGHMASFTAVCHTGRELEVSGSDSESAQLKSFLLFPRGKNNNGPTSQRGQSASEFPFRSSERHQGYLDHLHYPYMGKKPLSEPSVSQPCHCHLFL